MYLLGVHYIMYKIEIINNISLTKRYIIILTLQNILQPFPILILFTMSIYVQYAEMNSNGNIYRLVFKSRKCCPR